MPNRPYYLTRSLVLSVVVGGAALVAAACGASGDGDAGRAGIVPTRSALVAEFAVDPRDDGAWSDARAGLRRVPAFSLVEEQVPEPQQLVDQMLIAGGGKVNLDYQKDVRPWLGERAGVAGWYVDDEDRPFEAVAWIDTTDTDAALSAMARSFAKAKRTSYKDVDTFRGRDDADDVHWAAVADRLVLSQTAEGLREVIDASEGTSLEDGDDWRETTDWHDDREPLVALHVTEEAWEQAEAALRDRGTSLKAAERTQFEDLLEQARTNTRTFAIGVGASEDGAWLELGALGDSPAMEAGDGDARDELESLPASTLVGIGQGSGAGALGTQVESARKQLQQARTQLAAASPDEADAPDMALVEDVFALAEDLLSEETVEQLGEAYSGVSASGVVARDGQLALVASAEVEDEEAARELLDAGVRRAGAVLRQRSDLRLASSGSGEAPRVLTLSGIPAAKLRAALAAGPNGKPNAAQLKTIAANPLAKEFLQPSVQAESRIEGDRQLLGVPRWGVEELEGAADGETLADSDRYRADMRGLEIPEDVAVLGWVDAATLTRTVLEPIDARASFVVDGQLSHVGGPVFWLTTREHGKESRMRMVTELRLRK